MMSKNPFMKSVSFRWVYRTQLQFELWSMFFFRRRTHRLRVICSLEFQLESFTYKVRYCFPFQLWVCLGLGVTNSHYIVKTRTKSLFWSKQYLQVLAFTRFRILQGKSSYVLLFWAATFYSYFKNQLMVVGGCKLGHSYLIQKTSFTCSFYLTLQLFPTIWNESFPRFTFKLSLVKDAYAQCAFHQHQWDLVDKIVQCHIKLKLSILIFLCYCLQSKFP